MTPSGPGLARATLLATALLVLGACGRDARPPAAGAPDSLESGLPAGLSAPRRIVSLVPSATETLVDLGARDRLVGRTDYDTAAALASLPSVGGGIQPDLEAVLALHPDLVIRFAGPSDPETPRRLEAMGIPTLAVRPDGIDDVRRMVGRLGALVDRRGEARALVAHIDSALSAVRARVGSLPPVRVAYLLGGSPPWVAGKGTFIGQLIEVAGGTNVFDDLERLYAPVSAEELAVRHVDLFLVEPGAGVDRSALGKTPVRDAPPGLETPGPDLGESAAALARILHPEAFP